MTPQRDAPRVKPKFPVSPLLPTSEECWTFAGKPLPIMYEDEGQEEMGEANLHTCSDRILSLGIIAHLRPQPRWQVFSNLNCYYSATDRRAYVSPDVMVVEPYERLPITLTSYRIGEHGPAPQQAIEILSQRSFQQRDLTDKPVIYGQLAVAEYILADLTGAFLPERLLLMRRRRSGTWAMMQDADGGVTSKLGFRILIDTDQQFRVLDAATGTPYLRPDEAQAAEESRQKAVKQRDKEARARKKAEQACLQAAEARQLAEERIRQLEAELERLRQAPPRS